VGFIVHCGSTGPGGLRVERPGALTTLVRCERDHVLVVHGDLLDRTFALPPPGIPPEQLVALAGQAFARHCGVLVQGRTATLWTDHGALCPLHHTRDADGSLAVATSAAALLPLLGEPVRLRSGPRGNGCTGFTRVSAVPPGTMLALPVRSRAPRRAGKPDSGRFRCRSRSHFRLPSPHPVPAEEAVHEVAAALTAAVAGLLADRVSAGVLLSGGVDSSTVAALAATRLATLRTYTVGTPFGDEFAAARRLAEHIGSEHEELMFTPADLNALLPGAVRLLETWDLGTLQIVAPICFALDRLRGREEVLLTGYGADLLFAGLGAAGNDAETERVTRAGVLAAGCSNEFNPAVAEDSRIAVRHPYWTASMISTALSIPAALKLRDGTVKWVLRQAATQFVPPDVALRPKLAIQEGTAMHRMFAAVLGSDDPGVQAGRLRELAAAVFGPAGAASTARTGPQEEETHARVAGVAS
jgi:carbapenam-3-carboxylate synthase